MSKSQLRTPRKPATNFAHLQKKMRKHAIQALVDIRRYPGSKRHPHISRENLSSSLAEEDIEYPWLEALGGRRKKPQEPSPNQGLRNQGFRNYADYMGTEEFRQGVAKVVEGTVIYPGPPTLFNMDAL